jgi:hypothetical protein
MEGIEEKTYMLFIYGDFKDKEEGVEELALQLIPIVSSDFVKYNYGDHGVVYHFSTKEDFSDLKEYVDMILNGIIEQYFLMEKTENSFIFMPKILKDDLLKINKKENNDTKNGKIEINTNFKPYEYKDTDKIINMFMPIFDPEDIIYTPYEIYEPTVDEILEKITEKGIESITKQEREILENYAKRENRRSKNDESN